MFKVFLKCALILIWFLWPILFCLFFFFSVLRVYFHFFADSALSAVHQTTSVLFSLWIVFPKYFIHYSSCLMASTITYKLMIALYVPAFHISVPSSCLLDKFTGLFWVPSKTPPTSTQDRKLEHIPDSLPYLILLSYPTSDSLLILPLKYVFLLISATAIVQFLWAYQWNSFRIIQSHLSVVIKNVCGKCWNQNLNGLAQ